MTAKLHRLRTRRDRSRGQQADMLRELLISDPELPQNAVDQICANLDGRAAEAERWTFVMLSPSQNRAVVGWLREHSSRPLEALTLWAELFNHLRRDTGEITASRKELAAATGMRPENVSRVMTELAGCGAIIRRREGARTIYQMNPRVGTHLPEALRERAQEAAPLLRIIEGGQPA